LLQTRAHTHTRAEQTHTRAEQTHTRAEQTQHTHGGTDIACLLVAVRRSERVCACPRLHACTSARASQLAHFFLLQLICCGRGGACLGGHAPAAWKRARMRARGERERESGPIGRERNTCNSHYSQVYYCTATQTSRHGSSRCDLWPRVASAWSKPTQNRSRRTVHTPTTRE
jgi:hypothetical protein